MSVARLLLLLGVSGALAAPSEPGSPFLEGLDDFLAAFDGLALPGDPLAEAAEAGAQELVPAPVQEPEIVTEVAPCLGCVEEVSAVGDEYRRVAQLASELLEEELNMTQVTEVTQVYSAARQVVNGIKYILKMELVPTNCSRPREEGFECVPDSETPALLFSLEVLEHPQQEAGAELLSFREVAPEEVAGLPGLLSVPELTPGEEGAAGPDLPPAPASAEDQMAAIISEVERLAMPAPSEEVQPADLMGV